MPAGDHQFPGSADIMYRRMENFFMPPTGTVVNTPWPFPDQPVTGMLQLIGHQSTLGQTPRNFNFDPSGKISPGGEPEQ